ncbi:MAG: helicase HerA-like domain-containing protein, partial [Tepidiformaceae bacterium]
MAEKLYVGKNFDPATKALGENFTLDAEDFTTHGLIVGMTGSGKTGFSSVIIEECLRNGVPVIAIDPKGDLTNLALAFDKLSPEQFAPWVDTVASERDGKSREEAASEASASWSKGLAEWGISQPDVAAYVAGHDCRIITPGSSAGIPLNLIDSLDPPSRAVLDDEEDRRDQVDAVVTALLGLLRIDADPVRSREYMLLFALVENAWMQNQALTLSTLVAQVSNPPISQMGALPVDTVYPPNDREKLMLALNGLMASPPFAAWRQGEPVDIDSWIRGKDGKPRLTIIYTAHLEDDQRLFVTALILNRVKSWMRRQPGTGELRCLLYMDEIFGYFPPTANPPTKKPLLTLLKQARAFGVGVLLATQNPVDLDYKGLANMGFWAIGRLQTT